MEAISKCQDQIEVVNKSHKIQKRSTRHLDKVVRFRGENTGGHDVLCVSDPDEAVITRPLPQPRKR